MNIIWTKSKLPLSKIIRWVTGDDCSHLALVFESRNGGLMFESNLLGTHPKFFKNASKHFEIVHKIELPLSIEQENAAWDLMVDKFDGHGYDFLGILYLGACKLRKRFFGIEMPTTNKWASEDVFFCNELYAILEQVGAKKIGVNNGMLTPHDVWKSLD